MKIKLAIIFNLLILLEASTISITKCKCEQILSQPDCQNPKNTCLWDSDKCVTNPTPPVVVTQIVTYCSPLGDTVCQSTVGCAWIDKQCQQFAGCSAYYYTKHTECQYVSQYCSTDGFHCIDLGNCADYKTETACFKNQKGLLCYWNADKCQDFTECSQLPLTFQSDSECRKNLSKCTVGEQGGCMDSGDTCENQKLMSQCKWNKSQTQQCVWSDNKCLTLTCSSAPLTYKTDQLCNQFLIGCTTQENGGCTKITECSNAKIEAACVRNHSGQPCIWLDNSCYDQLCSKAPASFTTNDQCKKIGKNCITTMNGCIEQLSCSSSNNETGCIDMTDGTKCYWNGSQCLLKICSNNTSATSQAECEAYSSECTFNVTASIGCVDRICENITQQDQCSTDSFKNNCVWKNTCFTKQCVFAPKTYMTHNECEAYLASCILDNSGFGCMNKMLACQAYTSEKSCYQTQSGDHCAWKNSACVDRQCNMADSSITTTGGCQQFKSDCIVNNNQSGCMNLTSNCSDRQLQQNCGYGTSPVCIWNNNKCVQQSCETANVVGSPNYLTAFNQTNCNQYMNNCVLNNSSNGCIAKPSSCGVLSINNCFASTQNDCIWTGGQCKEKICSNLVGSTHLDCNNLYNQCTVNSSSNGCINIQRCSQYTIAEQCKLNQTGGQCIWTGLLCRESGCSDSTDNSNYDTYEKCQQLNSQCTVLSKVNQQGCVKKLNNCIEYKYEYQCHSTVNQVQCIWLQDQCQELQQINCSDIRLTTYNDANCSAVLQRCKVNNFSNGCINKICTDYLYTTKVDCERITGCTLNLSQNRCITKKDFCSEYTTDLSQCKYSKEGDCVVKGTDCLYTHVDCGAILNPTVNTDCSSKRDFCIIVVSGTTKTCGSGLCTSYAGGTISFEACQEYDYSCTVNRTGTGCVSMLNTCSAASSDSCYYTKNDHYCIWTGSVCKPVAIASEKNCQLKTDATSSLTYEKCLQSSNNYCSVNRAKNACTNIQADCTLYTNLSDCYHSSRGRCIQNQQTNAGASCIEMTNKIACNQIFLGETFTYTLNDCLKLKSTCTNDSTTGCKDKTCLNVDTMKTTHEDCQVWLPTCTINSSFNACVEMKLTCSEQTASSCLWSQEGQCIAVDNKCLKMACHLLSNSFTTHSQCENISNQCTITNKGGCITKLQNCSSYLTSIQCKFNYANQRCWWNSSTLNCIDFNCLEIEKTGISEPDCPTLKSCDLYTSSSQCVVDNDNKNCFWNTNTSKCQYRQCNVAALSYNSHQQCQNFDATCTVSVKLDDQQQQVIQGCQDISASCSDYKFEQQCYTNKDNKQCTWFESACTELSCKTAPKTADYSTYQACQSYLNNCTVSSDLLGCIPIPSKCPEISIELSCIRDGSGNDCFWYDSKCQIKTCSAAPPDQNTAQLCSSWLPTCTAEDTNKCKRHVCEEYEFTTDSECKTAMSSCTTDGTKCVKRGSCSTATSEAGCTKSVKEEQCYWVGNKCTLKECQVINKEKDCTLSYNNVKCIWDKGNCRNIGECQDYSGTTYGDCQKFNTSCTIGENQKCMKIKSCSDFTTQSSCVLGLDGPCKWIDKLAQCFLFTSCKSIQFKTDQECKQVSSLCTTDGLSCVPITLCNETNTNGGCVTGIDGDCIKTVPTLNSTQPPICKLFTSCIDAYYLTHQECQNASKSCTTDGLNGCISLGECNQYVNSASCKIDSIGKQIKNDQITSTGVCVWNETGQCRNQTCPDLAGSSHEQCTLQLSNCTYDGITCITKSSCTEYKLQETCTVAYGLEGKCNWNATLGTCQMYMCSSITIGSTLQLCQQSLPSCITDGSKCINKDMCSTYTTKIACSIGGTDGICVWNGQSCSLMQSCTQADQDQEACLSAKDRCAFKYATGLSTSSCYAHTCESYQKANGKCNSFYDWNQSSKRGCSFADGKCTEIEFNTLDQSQCFTVSEYTYTWSASKNRCQSCSGSKDTTTNQTTNSTNSTSNTSTPTTTVDDFAQNLELIIMFLIMVY
ncbi:unnamed protein product (macronuclear) [Paramecium tetraurelia]|uniref:PSI domain-containing protein n=1 Tax=Paramecium tetraurelia TaxID=5888 RepID=A0C6R2_PARTE|nr:uncharacterized protein GSPATT00035608001 [Paramecium tetraurelia]CAK66479.1 unnamed protein product [Paramecium tetraurelia]|eukprot:XP_001433876.1 hypothetical protein (macronuclear) [Paramecium tetraurelia strain d4-2]